MWVQIQINAELVKQKSILCIIHLANSVILFASSNFDSRKKLEMFEDSQSNTTFSYVWQTAVYIELKSQCYGFRTAKRVQVTTIV